MSVRRSFLVAFALMLTLAACSNGDETTSATGSPNPPSPTAEPSETPTETPSDSPTETPSAAGRGTEIESDDSAFGLILTDRRGNTLYAFLPDEQGPSTCYDDCAANWPALMARGELEVSGNDEDPTDADLLGTAPRDDGGQQVTYNGWPLYFFAADEAPGDTNGQGVGDVWYVVSPEGDPITG
jgi:predicted lipoprotein with Yx(FWY)xxD motif